MNLNLIEPMATSASSVLRFMGFWNCSVVFVRERYKGILDKKFSEHCLRPDNSEEYYWVNYGDCKEKIYNENDLLDKLTSLIYSGFGSEQRMIVVLRACALFQENIQDEDLRNKIVAYFCTSYNKYKVMEELIS